MSSSVCVGGMPPDDREVGLVRDDFAQQDLPVAGLRDDFEPAVGQQSRQALAEQQWILGERYSHGVVAVV